MNTTVANRTWFSPLSTRISADAGLQQLCNTGARQPNNPAGTELAAAVAAPPAAADFGRQAEDRVDLSHESQEVEGGGFPALSGLMSAFDTEPSLIPSPSAGAAKLRGAILSSQPNGNSGEARMCGTITFAGKSNSTVPQQKALVERVYKETAEHRMKMQNSERICLYYAQDIYKALMAEKNKKPSSLPDLQPRIFGWERAKEGVLGEAAQRQGRSESADFAHNLVVIEDAKGKPVMVLDPWQTGPMWNDSPVVFDSIETYRARREGGIGGLSGTLKAWPKDDELEVLTGLKQGR